jgi:hypothetical protein
MKLVSFCDWMDRYNLIHSHVAREYLLYQRKIKVVLPTNISMSSSKSKLERRIKEVFFVGVKMGRFHVTLNLFTKNDHQIDSFWSRLDYNGIIIHLDDIPRPSSSEYVAQFLQEIYEMREFIIFTISRMHFSSINIVVSYRRHDCDEKIANPNWFWKKTGGVFMATLGPSQPIRCMIYYLQGNFEDKKLLKISDEDVHQHTDHRGNVLPIPEGFQPTMLVKGDFNLNDTVGTVKSFVQGKLFEGFSVVSLEVMKNDVCYLDDDEVEELINDESRSLLSEEVCLSDVLFGESSAEMLVLAMHSSLWHEEPML